MMNQEVVLNLNRCCYRRTNDSHGFEPLPRSIRKRIRDIAGRICQKCSIIGGGIGHLTAWMMDLWCGDPAIEDSEGSNRPETLRVIEEGGKFE